MHLEYNVVFVARIHTYKTATNVYISSPSKSGLWCCFAFHEKIKCAPADGSVAETQVGGKSRR